MAAVSVTAASRVVGYQLDTADFNPSSPNLPQLVAILAEANDDNQASLNTSGVQITSAQQAGNLYGFGSPIYLIARILFPLNGGSNVSGIPVWVYAQAKAGGATSKIITVTPQGTANNNGTHTIMISGRDGLDGEFYDININAGDTTPQITAKMEDAVNSIIGAPCKASGSPYDCAFTSKWSGLSANELYITVDTGNDDLGIIYYYNNNQNGSGTPSIAPALAQFGNSWVTQVISGYGIDNQTQTSTAFEQYNGVPDPNNPTGRFQGIIFKPLVALTGSLLDDPSALTDSRSDQLTVAICPAPNSNGFNFEAAANMCAIWASIALNTPQLDVCGNAYPDMPTVDITAFGSMGVYANRDAMVKKGCSTVDLVGGVYQVQDFVTTYHPVGETPPQFRYVRNLNVDNNVRYGYYLLEQTHVVDHVIANDTDTVNAANVIKPKQWKGLLAIYGADLADRALLTDVPFFTKSIVVTLDTTNPDRLDTRFSYKRTGVARISATTATAGFNFGTIN